MSLVHVEEKKKRLDRKRKKKNTCKKNFRGQQHYFKFTHVENIICTCFFFSQPNFILSAMCYVIQQLLNN